MRIYLCVSRQVPTKAHAWMAELYCATRLVAWRVAGCRSLRGIRLLSRVRGHVRPRWIQRSVSCPCRCTMSKALVGPMV
jgi:hypothetical protein